MAEGRIAFGRRQARDGLDAVRAIHRLGGYRGVGAFQRYGRLKRNGKSYFATALSRVEVSEAPTASWLDDLDRHQWLDRFRRFGRGANTATRFLVLRKRLEDRLFALSGRDPTKAEVQSLLVLLGEIQSELATSRKAREEVPPIPRLSGQWIAAADDGTDPAFRIAKALAGLKGTVDKPLPLRAQLFPVERVKDHWMTPESGEKYRVLTGRRGRLIDTLRTLLERRLWLAEKLEMDDKPLDSPAGATLADIEAFLRDERMDGRIAELMPGLALCTIPQDHEHTAGGGVVPAAFALLKLCLSPHQILQSLDLLANGEKLPVPPGMLAQLAAGNHGNRALEIAWRRLRASGLAPAFALDSLPSEASIDPQRAAAALLIPLRFGATATLAHSVLKQSETETV
jgi:CRISPR-associated protein Csx17